MGHFGSKVFEGSALYPFFSLLPAEPRVCQCPGTESNHRWHLVLIYCREGSHLKYRDPACHVEGKHTSIMASH